MTKFKTYEQLMTKYWGETVPMAEAAVTNQNERIARREGMNEQALKTVVAFNNLPETDEIMEIKRRYLNDEISAFELVGIFMRYLEDKNDHSNHHWTEFDGSDKQIAEITGALGFIVRSLEVYEISEAEENNYIFIFNRDFESVDELKEYLEKVLNLVSYWIIPTDPLREIKVRHSQTGQPVFVRRYFKHYGKWVFYEGTTKPDWDIPNAEYSFTEFKD